jgi:hypothetical protein
MNPGPKPVRWFVIVLVGVGLGLVYVYLNLSLMTLPTDERIIRVHRAPPGRLQVSQASRTKELTGVIDSQLVAFRNGDYSKAYKYAATARTAQLSLRQFERMVRRGYPVIASSRTAAFGSVFDNGVEATVNVSITDAAGDIHHFQYFLRREPSGWKISGVIEVESQGTTTI